MTAATPTPPAPVWETVRAALLRVGDRTPAGTVDALRFDGGVRRITITIAGLGSIDRGFDDAVDRQVVDELSAYPWRDVDEECAHWVVSL